MQSFPYVLLQSEEINTLLHKPVNSTQRIKYTCFHVSSNYIALGSTTGSIYLFNREPCIFQQLIPLSEGAVTCVSISPDEKTIGLGTIRGTVCVVILKPNPKLIATSTEVIDDKITCLCWNNNGSELYSGSISGRVSAIVLSVFTVNGMFQTPSCALMNLDSGVIQISFHPPLLLVSTLTRCYICDTIKEQYKQIGNKVRHGEFGACFYTFSEKSNETASNTVTKNHEKAITPKNSFSLIQENDENLVDDGCLKLFCARPGSRIWEVSASGTVVKTHQFKEALAIPPSPVFNTTQLDTMYRKSTDFRYMADKQNYEKWMAQSIVFSNLTMVARKYLFSHTTCGLYIIDPIYASVILWNNEFANIAMASVVANQIYLMTTNLEFYCFALTSLDTLILKLYWSKQYKSSLLACKVFEVQLINSIEKIESKSNSIDNEANVASNNEIIEKNSKVEKVVDICNYNFETLNSIQNEIVISLLQPLVSFLTSSFDKHPIKLDSGIIMVHSGSLNLIDNHIQGNKSETNSLKPVNIISSKQYDNSSNVHFINKFTPSTNNDKGLENQKDIYENNITENTVSNNYIGDENSKIIKCLNSSKETCNPNVTIAVDKNNSAILDNENPLEPTINTKINEIQIVINDIFTSIDTITTDMTESKLEKVISEIQQKFSVIKNSYSNLDIIADFIYEITRSAELHYFSAMLNNAPAEVLISTSHEIIIDQFQKAFIDMNVKSFIICSCGAQSVITRSKEPKYLNIGRILLKKIVTNPEKCINFCKQVPFMWREYLPMYLEQDFLVDKILRECLLSRDNLVLSIILPRLTFKQLEDLLMYLNIVEEGKCPYCSKIICEIKELEGVIDWTIISKEILKRNGVEITIQFLNRLETILPNISVNRSLFQSLIFTKILQKNGVSDVAIDLSKNNLDTGDYNSMCSSQTLEELVDYLNKDLGRPINKSSIRKSAHHWGSLYRSKSKICPCCTLSLQTPVLLGTEGIAIFSCNHAYHVNCMIEKKLFKCNLHTQT